MGLILNMILPRYHLIGTYSLPLDMWHLFLLESNILLSTVVQQQVLILEYSQEKKSARPFTPLSCLGEGGLKLKKVGKTTRPFRYDLNQIPYDYTVEVTNRFKGLDLIHRVPEELWMRFLTLYRRQGSRPYPRKRNVKRQNVCLRGNINSWEKMRSKRQRRKGNIYPFECRVPKNSKER